MSAAVAGNRLGSVPEAHCTLVFGNCHQNLTFDSVRYNTPRYKADKRGKDDHNKQHAFLPLRTAKDVISVSSRRSIAGNGMSL